MGAQRARSLSLSSLKRRSPARAVNCNYGTTMVPLDKMFGTYEDGSKWAKKEATA